MKIIRDLTVENIFYPKSKTNASGYLGVGDGHELFYFELGNPDGPPVILVHGGPGGSIPEGHFYTRHHDPSFFRIIAVDQRGCGQSRPHVAEDRKGAFHKNDPFTLAEDFEKLRVHLGIEKWHVYGYSWGSCLGTLYATEYPQSVLSLTIGGIWMHTASEIDWYFNRMGMFIPEFEQEVLKLLPKTVKRFDRARHIHKVITGKDEAAALKMAEAQGFYEYMGTLFSSEQPDLTKPKTAKEKSIWKRRMISLGALECTFMIEHPLKDGWYASPAARKALNSIRDFHIIQGRYDIVCPPTMAYELHSLYAHSTFTMVQYAGHSTTELNMLSALIDANNRLKFAHKKAPR